MSVLPETYALASAPFRLGESPTEPDLLHDNAEHVAACGTIDSGAGPVRP